MKLEFSPTETIAFVATYFDLLRKLTAEEAAEGIDVFLYDDGKSVGLMPRHEHCYLTAAFDLDVPVTMVN